MAITFYGVNRIGTKLKWIQPPSVAGYIAIFKTLVFPSHCQKIWHSTAQLVNWQKMTQLLTISYSPSQWHHSSQFSIAPPNSCLRNCAVITNYQRFLILFFYIQNWNNDAVPVFAHSGNQLTFTGRKMVSIHSSECYAENKWSSVTSVYSLDARHLRCSNHGFVIPPSN